MKESKFYYSQPRYKADAVVCQDGLGGYYIADLDLNKKLEELPRLSLCGVLDTETDTLSFGAAICSFGDRFERKIGREIAEKRALEDPITVVPVTKENISQVFIQVALYLESRILYYRNLTVHNKVDLSAHFE